MDNEAKANELAERYAKTLEAIFLPEDAISNDIVNYFSSLLRVAGYEGEGWDPYLESKGILDDLNKLISINLPEEHFPESELTRWRLALTFYSHVVEMDAIYEILTNLLRFRLGKGYSPNPYFIFLTEKQKARYAKKGLYPKDKIQIIKTLSKEAGLGVGDLLDEFYNGKLRNAISHSDYIISEDSFRCRNGGGASAFQISLQELNDIILKTKIFVSAFFGLHEDARKIWGQHKNRAIPYDPHYKGLMEVLVNENDLMCGFKVHWPNHSECYYKRTDDGCKMVNMWCDPAKGKIQLFVDLYASKPSAFSPLVEFDKEPSYSKLDSGETPTWTG